MSDHSGKDLPFYDGRPVAIGASGWLLAMVGVALGFAVLIAPLPPFSTAVGQFVPAIAFFAIPLAVFAIVARRHWTALFGKVGGREIGWMFAFAGLNLVVTLTVAALVSRLFPSAANPVFGTLAGQDGASRLLFFLKTLPQLFGEEVVTILPLLALAWWFHSVLKLGRAVSILLAWLLSALLFGAMHLPTYDWNFLQCFLIIGTARLVLSLAYLKTRNIWVSTGAHVINDWVMFGVALLLGGLVG
ncbi:CPBP family intramembrane metalloprotease [Lysobacter maris]|uniref:CPBP family intramembrane metalloprotease n=1 Tax=Marilutibacter maris TaxID=1605891 RepID=A0A508B127_9GAMM|nr:CPBP family glutamic-type intramembrane protease [Lysobacter maris]KAB8198134.1 CPBP family intramembrane metalloprotease [Lysobacter maris]